MKELKEIQKMVMNEMRRLDDNEYMKENNNEVARANALSQNASVFIKTVNTSIRLEEIKRTYGVDFEK